MINIETEEPTPTLERINIDKIKRGRRIREGKKE